MTGSCGSVFKRSLSMLAPLSDAHLLIRMASSYSPNNSAASSHTVLLPPIPELLNPRFLDALLPLKVPIETATVVPAPSNPIMDALKAISRQTFTANMAPAYTGTDSAVLDAFTTLSRYTTWSQIETYLDASWKEDSNMTLRLVWNLRSIHDGKGEKEAFYRLVLILYCSSFTFLTNFVPLAPLDGFTRTIPVLPFPIWLFS